MDYEKQEKEATDDLEWLFNYSQSDCGIKSNWTAMCLASIYGSSSFTDHYNSFILNSVSRLRQVEKIYNSLSILDQKILYITFTDMHINAYVQKIFKKYSGAAYCSNQVSTYSLEQLCKRFSMSKSTSDDKMLLSKIRIEAQSNFANSVQNYIKIKRNQQKTIKNNKKSRKP